MQLVVTLYEMHPALGELLLQAEQLHHEADVGLDRAGLAQLAEAPGLELETKVHPKVRNHGEGPY